MKEGFFGVCFFPDNAFDSLCDGKLDFVFCAEYEQGGGGGYAFREFFRRQPAHEILAETAIVAVRGEERRLVVAEMRKPVNGRWIAAHRADEPRKLRRAARHQRAFQAGEFQSVEHPSGKADYVFRRGADFRA